MPTFGRYEIGEELSRKGATFVASATPGESAGPLVIKVFQVDTTLAPPGQVATQAAAFVAAAQTQKKVAGSGSSHWAPVHDIGSLPDGAYYVTHQYRLTAHKLIRGKVRLPAAQLFALADGTIKGLRELKRVCGRAHGNLKPSNIFLESPARSSSIHVRLADPSDQSDSSSEAGDLAALGGILYELVTQQAARGYATWPIPASAAWDDLGRDGDRWRELCNRLLHPGADPTSLSLDSVGYQVAALSRGAQPRKMVRLLGLAAATAAVGVLGAIVTHFVLARHPSMSASSVAATSPVSDRDRATSPLQHASSSEPVRGESQLRLAREKVLAEWKATIAPPEVRAEPLLSAWKAAVAKQTAGLDEPDSAVKARLEALRAGLEAVDADFQPPADLAGPFASVIATQRADFIHQAAEFDSTNGDPIAFDAMRRTWAQEYAVVVRQQRTSQRVAELLSEAKSHKGKDELPESMAAVDSALKLAPEDLAAKSLRSEISVAMSAPSYKERLFHKRTSQLLDSLRPKVSASSGITPDQYFALCRAVEALSVDDPKGGQLLDHIQSFGDGKIAESAFVQYVTEVLADAKHHDAPPLGDPFKYVKEAEAKPDYAIGDWFIDCLQGKVGALTPLVSSDWNAFVVQGRVLETLAFQDPNTLEYLPQLATSWQMADNGMSCTFQLRRGVLFSDGEPFSADDVVFTFDWIMNPKVQAARDRAYLEKIKSVEKTGNYEVAFHFSEPFFQGFDLASQMDIMPKHVYSKYTPEQFNEAKGLLIGSGPYMLDDHASWRPGQRVELVRNSHYWGETPSFDRIIYEQAETDAARLAMFRDGQIDAFTATPEQYQMLLKDRQLLARTQHFEISSPLSGYMYIGWNQKRSGKPTIFSDKRVRTAMTLLTDRQRICDELMMGYATTADGPLDSSGKPQQAPDVHLLPYDPARAKALLKDAGFADRGNTGVLQSPDGQPFEFKLMYPAGMERVVLLIKDSCAQVGIKVDLEPTDFSVMTERMSKRDFDAVSVGWSGEVEQDPYQIFDSSQISDEGDNFISYSNPELDHLIRKARATVDEAARMKMWQECSRIIHEDQPYTFLYRRKSLVFMAARIKNVGYSKLGLNGVSTLSMPLPWYVPRGEQKWHPETRAGRDLSDPRKAAIAYLTDFKGGDLQALNAASIGTESEHKLLETLARMMRQNNELQAAAVERFGVVGKQIGIEAKDLPMLSMLAQCEEKVDGDSATFSKPGAEDWMKLKKVGGKWKVDLAFMTVPEDEKQEIYTRFPKLEKLMISLTAEIKAGKYKTFEDAKAAFQQAGDERSRSQEERAGSDANHLEQAK